MGAKGIISWSDLPGILYVSLFSSLKIDVLRKVVAEIFQSAQVY